MSSVQEQYVADVNSRISSGRYRMEYGGCPCGADDGDIIAQIDRYGIALDTVLCSACGTLRFDPYLSAESLTEFYRFSYQDMYARAPDPEIYFARQQHYGRRLLELARQLIRPGAVVVEVGCGAGGALSVFNGAGYETFGCDYSARLIEEGSKRGLRNLVLGDISELIDHVTPTGRKADLIFLHHVFEHLSSPVSWLTTAQELLADDGVIVIAVPDVAAIDGYPSPNGDLRLFLHIAHKYNFSRKGLSVLANRVGLSTAILGVEPSDQAPELWVAFSRVALAGNRAADASLGSSPTALFRRLRMIEIGYVRRGAARKLRKLPGRCTLALRRLFPNRDARPSL